MEPKPSSEQRFALLIDADNVSAKYLKPIMDELSKYGTVTYKRIYGDWTLTLHAKWKDALLENSITPIQQFGYTQGKNATDSAMIIDAMDILYTRSVEGFCIVSSDSDFTRLASRIRESGLTVIGMGEKKTPVPFRKACDIFTTLELLLPAAQNSNGKANGRGKGKPEQGGQAAAGQNTGPSIEEIERAVVNIITDNLNNGKSTGLGEVGSRLLKRYPDFDVRSYGTNQLKKLLDEFDGIVITKDGSSVTVELAEDKAPAAEAASKGTVPEDAEGSEAATVAAPEPSEAKAEEPPAAQEAPAPAPDDASGDSEGAERAGSVEKKPRRSTRVSSNRNAKGRRGAGRDADAASQAKEAAEGPADMPGAPAAEEPAESSPERPEAAAPEPEAAPVATPGTPEPAQAAEPAQPVVEDNRPGRARRRAAAERKAPSSRNKAQAREAEQEGQPKGEAQPQKPKQPRKAKQVRKPAQAQAPQPARGAQPPAHQDEERAEDAHPAPKQAKKPVKGARNAQAPDAEPAKDEQPSREQVEESPKGAADPQAYVRQLVAEAGPAGVELSALGKRVRARYRTFKLRDLGYSQFKSYVADLEGIAVERRGDKLHAVARG